MCKQCLGLMYGETEAQIGKKYNESSHIKWCGGGIKRTDVSQVEIYAQLQILTSSEVSLTCRSVPGRLLTQCILKYRQHQINVQTCYNYSYEHLIHNAMIHTGIPAIY